MHAHGSGGLQPQEATKVEVNQSINHSKINGNKGRKMPFKAFFTAMAAIRVYTTQD